MWLAIGVQAAILFALPTGRMEQWVKTAGLSSGAKKSRRNTVRPSGELQAQELQSLAVETSKLALATARTTRMLMGQTNYRGSFGAGVRGGNKGSST